MNKSKSFIRPAGLIFSTTIAAFIVGTVFSGNANAACAILSKDARGSSIERAGHKAKRKAIREVRQTAGRKAVQNATLSEPACVHPHDGISALICTVEASYCTDPVVHSPEPEPKLKYKHKHKHVKYHSKWKHSKWHKRRYVAGGWHRSTHQATRQEVCLHYKARASGVTKHEAVHTAFGAISRTAKGQIHVGLRSPGFEIHEPNCSYRAGSSYPYVCHTAASYCPSSSW